MNIRRVYARWHHIAPKCVGDGVMYHPHGTYTEHQYSVYARRNEVTAFYVSNHITPVTTDSVGDI